MSPWPSRRGKEAQLAALRAHVETMWAIACTLTGDEVTAVEVVKQVVRGTLPQRQPFSQRGLRLEVVVAATEAAAARVFSPLDRRARARAYATALSPQASALRRAFSRRVSWDLQALLWATEVEGIAESDVERRLGQIHPGREAGRVALRLAYLDLRSSLDASCQATLRDLFGSSGDSGRRAEDPHLGRCALCLSERRWLTDLRWALRSLPPAMPSDVWEEARRLALTDTRQRSKNSLRSGVGAQSGDAISAQRWPSPTESRRRAPVLLSTADQATAAVGDATTNGSEPVLVSRGVDAPKVEAQRVEVQTVKARKVVDRVVYL